MLIKTRYPNPRHGYDSFVTTWCCYNFVIYFDLKKNNELT